MNKRICVALSALLCAVMFALPAFAVAETQPLTPDGNLEIVDDIVHEDKQFITVKSRSGAEFYIVIDRSRDSDNVYFLNQVDDVDLFALLEEDSAASCSCKEKCAVGMVNSDCLVCRMDMKSCAGKAVETKAEQTTPDSKPAETVKKQNILPVILIVGVIGGGAIIGFLKLRKNKPKAASVPDFDDDTDDEDFVEEETEVEDGDK